MPGMLVKIGSGYTFCHPIRLGTDVLGYVTLYVPEDSHSIKERVPRHTDRTALDGTIWRHTFVAAEPTVWSFPIIVRQYSGLGEKTMLETFLDNIHLTYNFWDHTTMGNYALAPVPVMINEIGEFQVRNHDPYLYDSSLTLRSAT